MAHLRLLVAVACLVLVTQTPAASAAETGTIIGSRMPCSEEGEAVNVSIKNMRCFSCICKNGFVECHAKRCPSQEGCYWLLHSSRDSCCSTCKGCKVQGKNYESGAEWRDPLDPCRVFSCKAGVVTESQEHCYTPCKQPLPSGPGQCCPTCPAGCQTSEGNRSMRSSTLVEDPCVSCQCASGRLSCSKKACPVLNCPAMQIEEVPGACCPVCKVSRRLQEPPSGMCILGTEMKSSGQSFRVDHCTSCNCVNGTSICRRASCSALDCPAERQMTVPGKCCPHCPPALESKAACTVSGNTYMDGQQWRLGPCKWCLCAGGVARCTVERCPAVSCPPHQRMVQPPGECCPKCVDSDGVCTVFGDPHYRTFDGKLFSFQGSCKYQLTADCVDHTFSIRVTNDARGTKTSAWTKTVSVKVGNLKVNLGQRLRVKVNGVRITPPFRLENQVTVEKPQKDSVLVSTAIGLNVTWDGNSFLEVSVPTSYKGRLCGLCGNFNSIARDDLTTRRATMAPDAEKFAASWRVGGRHACARPQPETAPEGSACSRLSNNRRIRDYRRCKPLQSDAFSPCHKKVNAEAYFKSCLLDMCECPSGRCYCEAFMAYAHECRRAGAVLGDWRAATGCEPGWAEESRMPFLVRGRKRGPRRGRMGAARRKQGARRRGSSRESALHHLPGLRLPQAGAPRPPPPNLH